MIPVPGIVVSGLRLCDIPPVVELGSGPRRGGLREVEWTAAEWIELDGGLLEAVRADGAPVILEQDRTVWLRIPDVELWSVSL